MSLESTLQVLLITKCCVDPCAELALDTYRQRQWPCWTQTVGMANQIFSFLFVASQVHSWKFLLNFRTESNLYLNILGKLLCARLELTLCERLCKFRQLVLQLFCCWNEVVGCKSLDTFLNLSCVVLYKWRQMLIHNSLCHWNCLFWNKLHGTQCWYMIKSGFCYGNQLRQAQWIGNSSLDIGNSTLEETSTAWDWDIVLFSLTWPGLLLCSRWKAMLSQAILPGSTEDHGIWTAVMSIQSANESTASKILQFFN